MVRQFSQWRFNFYAQQHDGNVMGKGTPNNLMDVMGVESGFWWIDPQWCQNFEKGKPWIHMESTEIWLVVTGTLVKCMG